MPSSTSTCAAPSTLSGRRLPAMCDAGYGRVVLTSSIGGIYGNHRIANYATSKAGLIGLCNVVALEGAS